MAVRYEDVIANLRESYDRGAAERDSSQKQPWKLELRAAFHDLLQTEGCDRLLEVGAGTGQDSLYFQEQGMNVVATDLSPQMVARCRAKGLTAHVMDFLHLEFPQDSFDAVYALNCLLHVPNADLPTVLEMIRKTTRPGGLLFVGVYGGDGTEGILKSDRHDPPRFFSWRTDEQIQQFACGSFRIEDFQAVDLGVHRFQALTLRRAW